MIYLFKNIIFDFDGVIINSHDVQIKALTESFKAICGAGVPPYDDFFRHSGDSLKNIFMQLGLPLDMVPIYQMVSKENIDLIISDVVMPKIDGVEFIKRARENRKTIKVIFISGYAEDTLNNSIIQDKYTCFLQKPFTLRDLALKVKEIIDN